MKNTLSLKLRIFLILLLLVVKTSPVFSQEKKSRLFSAAPVVLGTDKFRLVDRGHSVRCVALSHDGKTIACGGGKQLGLFSAQSVDRLRTFDLTADLRALRFVSADLR